MKKIIGIMLTVSIISALFLGLSITAYAESTQVTVNEAFAWLDSQKGVAIQNPLGGYAGECASLGAHYYKKLTGRVIYANKGGTGNGKDFSDANHSTNLGWSKGVISSGTILQKGDVIVKTNTTYGHVSIFSSGTPGSATLYESNYNGYKYVRVNTGRNIIGLDYVRPVWKNQPTPSQPPPTTPTPNQPPPTTPTPPNTPAPDITGWTRIEEAPQNAVITERKWTYTTTETFESTEKSIAGATLINERWDQTGTGSRRYANFPGGFDTSHSIYKDYDKSPVAAFDNGSTKREVSNRRVSFIYWHWTYEPGSPTSSVNNRYIQDNYGYNSSLKLNFIYFHAVVNDVDYPFVASANAYNWNGGGIYWTWWWNRCDLNQSDYVDYTKTYTYSRYKEAESFAYPSGANIANIQEWVKCYIPQSDDSSNPPAQPPSQTSTQIPSYQPPAGPPAQPPYETDTQPPYDNEPEYGSEYEPEYEPDYGSDNYPESEDEQLYAYTQELDETPEANEVPKLFARPNMDGASILLYWKAAGGDGYYLLRDNVKLNNGNLVRDNMYIDTDIEAARQYTYILQNASTGQQGEPLTVKSPVDPLTRIYAHDSPDSWAEAEVIEASLNGLLTEEMTYNYRQNTNRAQFCRAVIALLDQYNKYDTKQWIYESGMNIKLFSDTDDKDIAAAAALGIVLGTDAERNLFSPDDELTREQAATMLKRVIDYVRSNGKYKKFDWEDGDIISPWALDAVNALHTCGIMNGVSGTAKIFAPQDSYTNQQSILTLIRLYKYLSK